MTLREAQKMRRETKVELDGLPEFSESDNSLEARSARKNRELLERRLDKLDEKISRLTGAGHPTDCTCTGCQWRRQGDGVKRVAWSVKVPEALKERLREASRAAGQQVWESELRALAEKYC